jgi:hypothetical protein
MKIISCTDPTLLDKRTNGHYPGCPGFFHAFPLAGMIPAFPEKGMKDVVHYHNTPQVLPHFSPGQRNMPTIIRTAKINYHQCVERMGGRQLLLPICL